VEPKQKKNFATFKMIFFFTDLFFLSIDGDNFLKCGVDPMYHGCDAGYLKSNSRHWIGDKFWKYKLSIKKCVDALNDLIISKLDFSFKGAALKQEARRGFSFRSVLKVYYLLFF